MKRTLYIIVAIFLILQLFQTDKTNPNIDKNLEITAPTNIHALLKDACYDCHSNKTVWPSYSYIAPFSWSIKRNVKNGRAALDFSLWGSYTKEEKQKHLKSIYRTVYAAMPLSSYIIAHEKADLTKMQREELRKWTGVKPY